MLIPSLFFYQGQTTEELMEIMATSFQRSHAHTAALRAPNPAACHPWLMPLVEPPGHSGECLGWFLVGSVLLSSGSWHTEAFVCALQESVSPVLCKLSSSLVGFMVTSSKKVYIIRRSTVSRVPVPAAAHCWTVPPQETLNHSSESVSVGSLGSSAHKFCLILLSISRGYGVCF